MTMLATTLSAQQQGEVVLPIDTNQSAANDKESKPSAIREVLLKDEFPFK